MSEEILCVECKEMKSTDEFIVHCIICEKCRIDKNITNPHLPSGNTYLESDQEELDTLNKKEWLNIYKTSLSTSGIVDHFIVGHISLRINEGFEWYDSFVYYCPVDNDPLDKNNWRVANWYYSGTDVTLSAAKYYLKNNGFGSNESRWKMNKGV